MTARYTYVDETIQRGFVLVAVQVRQDQRIALRRVVQQLRKPGQRRIHMKNERDARRREIASALARCEIDAVVYDAARRHKTELEARRHCLNALVDDCVTGSTVRIVLDRDETLAPSDRRWLYAAIRERGLAAAVTYGHDSATSEPLLVLPDAIAWCWAKSGDWRRRIEPLIRDVRCV